MSEEKRKVYIPYDFGLVAANLGLMRPERDGMEARLLPQGELEDLWAMLRAAGQVPEGVDPSTIEWRMFLDPADEARHFAEARG